MDLWSPVVCKGFESAMSVKGEPAGMCPELARRVREVTGDVASRVAARRAGISHDTIIRMWAGDRVSEGMILRFAQGYDADPNPLLEAAGYSRLPARQVLTVKDGSQGGEIEGVSDSQDSEESPLRVRMMAAFDQLPMRLKQLEVEQAEALLEEMYRGRKDIIGKRAE